MAGHTEGPWTIPTPSMGFSEIRGGSGELIFGLAAGGPDEKQDDDTCDANARLIAAAPDMYAACKFLEVYAEVQVRRHPDATDTPNWRALLAAIAKAEGQP